MTPLAPLLLDLRSSRVLVVGGGAVALRRVRTLVDAGARPEIVAPDICRELGALAERVGLVVQRRPFREGDAAGCRLAIAATSVPAVNAAVAAEAHEAGAWVNVVDDPEASTFQVPATLRRGPVLVSVSTGSAAPLLARRLRDRIETVVTPGVGRAAGRLVAARARVRALWPDDPARRRELWSRLITPEFVDSAIAGRDEEVDSRIERCLSQS